MQKLLRCVTAVFLAVLTVVMPLSLTTTAQGEASIEIFGGRNIVKMALTDVIDTFYDYAIYPQDNGEEVTWTIEDETVLRLNNRTGEIRPVAPGVTALTVTTDTGLSDTVTVTVPEPTAWSPDETKTLFFSEYGQMQTFVFVPTESGDYTLYSEGEGDPFVEVYDSKLKRLKGADDERDFDFLMQISLTAGETYYIGIGAYDPTITNVTLQTGVEDHFTSLAFAQEHITLNVGDLFYPLFHYEPIAMPFRGCDIVSADDSVAVPNDFGVMAQGVGTTTVTATAEDGTTATMTVTVEDPVALTVGSTADVVFDKGIMIRSYTLTVEETATYVIQSYDAATVDVELRNEQGHKLKMASAEGAGFLIKTTLEAGLTYRLDVLAFAPDRYTELEIGIAKADASLKPTAMDIVFDPSIVVKRQEGEVWLSLGSYLYPQVVLYGEYGMSPPNHTVTVEDDGILVDEWGFGTLLCAAVGDTTLTATTADGLSCTYTVHVVKELHGDVDRDGKVDIADAVSVFRHANGGLMLSVAELARYDINGDNNVNLADAVMLFRYANGRIADLP